MTYNPHEKHRLLELHNTLIGLLHVARKQFEKLSNSEWENIISPDKWSKKEILGHLIDSASKNHQRFVRAQIAEQLEFPGYEQDLWVKVQNYQNFNIKDLVELWYNYNFLLSNVITNIREENLIKSCKIGNNNPVTLLYLIEDYIAHLKHHLQQIIREI